MGTAPMAHPLPSLPVADYHHHPLPACCHCHYSTQSVKHGNWSSGYYQPRNNGSPYNWGEQSFTGFLFECKPAGHIFSGKSMLHNESDVTLLMCLVNWTVYMYMSCLRVDSIVPSHQSAQLPSSDLYCCTCIIGFS